MCTVTCAGYAYLFTAPRCTSVGGNNDRFSTFDGHTVRGSKLGLADTHFRAITWRKPRRHHMSSTSIPSMALSLLATQPKRQHTLQQCQCFAVIKGCIAPAGAIRASRPSHVIGFVAFFWTAASTYKGTLMHTSNYAAAVRARQHLQVLRCTFVLR